MSGAGYQQKVENVNNKAFNLMTTATDKTAVDFRFSQDKIEKERIESILDAEFEKKDYGEKSAWFPTGKFMGQKIPRGVSGWVDALVLLAAGNVQNIPKALIKEETVTVYRGVDKWYKGSMVKKGKFVGGGQYDDSLSLFLKVEYGKTKDAIWVTDKKRFAEKFSRKGGKVKDPVTGDWNWKGEKGPVLEFAIPKSIADKILIDVSPYSRVSWKKFAVRGGISKRFLVNVHK